MLSQFEMEFNGLKRNKKEGPLRKRAFLSLFSR
jgi:hypothetical protein